VIALLFLFLLAGCAASPGQADHLFVFADHGSKVIVENKGAATGGTSSASPEVQTSIPVSLVPK